MIANPTPENPCPLCKRTGEENDGFICGCLYNCYGEEDEVNSSWITEDGWTHRENSYVRCGACDLPVDKVTSDSGICEECWFESMGVEL